MAEQSPCCGRFCAWLFITLVVNLEGSHYSHSMAWASRMLVACPGGFCEFFLDKQLLARLDSIDSLHGRAGSLYRACALFDFAFYRGKHGPSCRTASRSGKFCMILTRHYGQAGPVLGPRGFCEPGFLPASQLILQDLIKSL